MRLATVIIVASPWLLLFAGLAIISGTVPWWSIIGLSVIILASALLVGIAGGLAEVEDKATDCPDFVEDDS